MKNTDPDKKAVYFAEAIVFEGTLYDETVPDSAVETMAAELFGSDWWQSQGIPTPKLSLRRLEALSSHALTWHPTIKRDPEIRFSVQQVNAWTLSHEAAHIANDHLFRAYSDQNVTSHGREFREVYTTVAEILLGREAADDLQKAFNRYIPYPNPTQTLPTKGHTDPEGIFPRWRMARQVEELRHLTKDAKRDTLRINGAIAL